MCKQCIQLYIHMCIYTICVLYVCNTVFSEASEEISSGHLMINHDRRLAMEEANSINNMIM